jgi:hypothetical protein
VVRYIKIYCSLQSFDNIYFNPRELAKLRGYTSCFVVVAVAVAVAAACMQLKETATVAARNYPAVAHSVFFGRYLSGLG